LAAARVCESDGEGFERPRASVLDAGGRAQHSRKKAPGKWGYLEHDWTATAGDFIYETPGESHTLVAYEHPEPMRVFFVISAPLMWLDEEGNTTGCFDVNDYVELCKTHYEKSGLGAAEITKLFR
jgi:2,4'-dihydroxyacetophenone dioxygenase